MLRKIGLVNFKCFRVLDLPCAPLNLLCGLNGMGKSSVIQALLVLRQSFGSKELEAGHLVLGGDLIDLGAGSDVLFEGAEDEVIQFVLIDERTRRRGEFGRCPVTGKGTSSIFAPEGDAKAKSILNELLAGKIEKNDLEGRVANPDAFRLAISRARKEGVKEIQAPSRYFDSMVHETWYEAFEYSRTSDSLTAVADDSERAEKGLELGLPGGSTIDVLLDWSDVPPFGGRFHYVPAERIGPRKSYSLSEVAARRDDLGSCGEYTLNYLNDHRNDPLPADDPRCADAAGRRLVNVVDHWLQDVSPGAHLQLEAVPTADAVLASFTFDRPGDVQSRRHRATNVGFGLSYVLPVVLALLAPPGALCLIENPEAHLHPRGQTKLAELAVRAAQAGVQVFVETHSDHFMDGVRIAVRDGLIAPADAAIHYFERRDGSVVVESPEIDADGRLSHWPAGFFDQHDENLLRLLAPRT